MLGPGEQVDLLAWFVPAMDDLAAWFDICGSIQQLALQEAGAPATAGDAACKAGLTTILGEAVCARSQGDSEDDGRRRVASLLWDRLRQEAEPLVAQVGMIALVHAVPRPLAAPKVEVQRPIGVARRLDVGVKSAAAFLGRVPDTTAWPGRQDEDDAVGVVVGGTVLLDPASTAGVIVVADLASPNGPLDPAALAAPTDPMLVPADPEVPKAAFVDGKPVFEPQSVTLLEIAGLPPAPGGASRPFDLSALQQQASEPGTTLRVIRPAHFADGGARRLNVRVGALPTHAALLELDDHRDIVWLEEPIALWLHATIRPSVPEPIELLPLFSWEERRPGAHDPVLVWTKTRSAGLRLTLRQPWFSAGEGEELGLVFWPPPDAALPPAVGTRSPDPVTLSELWEDDIGPLGPFVSAWGRDPLRTTEPAGTTRFALRRSDLTGSDDPLVPEDLVLVPVRGEARLPDGTPVEQEVPACLLRVAPRYDEQSRHWYADLGIAPAVARRLADRFVRLGLVRYQPHAREDRPDAPDQTRRSIRCSPPTTVWTVMPPRRELRATLTRDLLSPSASLLTVRLTGVGDPAPAAGSLLPRAVVVFEILELTATNETVGCDSDGKPLRADNHASRPAILEGTEHDLRTWTAGFILPVPPAAALGRYAIAVSEADTFPRAGEAPPEDVTPGPLRFFARLNLDVQA